LNPEDGTDKLSRNFVINYHYSPRNNPEERNYDLIYFESPPETDNPIGSTGFSQFFQEEVGTVLPLATSTSLCMFKIYYSSVILYSALYVMV